MSHVQLDGVTKSYGPFHAVNGVDLQVAQGEFVTLLGASGSGKTTCLRMIAGFVAPTVGRVLIGGRDVTNVPPYRRNIGMVFQQYALFPHLTVAENIGYGLKVRRQSSSEVAARTKEALHLVRLEELAHRYPRQLSGGQKQRVALARAVVIKPQVLLLDEPLAALDLKLREELQSEIKRVQQAVGITTVFVTHDQGEALSLSDRVAVMREGKILQIEPPTELYRRPNSRYVAGFIGRMNFLDVVVKQRAPDGLRHVVALRDDPSVSLEVAGAQSGGFALEESCILAFRPEITHLCGSDRNTIPVRVSQSTYVGENWVVSCATGADKTLTVNVPRALSVPAAGTATHVTWAAQDCLLLKRDEQIGS